jgi:transposase-like protein
VSDAPLPRRTPEELAREFEPTAQPISTWVKQAERDADKRIDRPTSAEREEPGRLRRENHRPRQERDILAKGRSSGSSASLRQAACSPAGSMACVSKPGKAEDEQLATPRLPSESPGDSDGDE